MPGLTAEGGWASSAQPFGQGVFHVHSRSQQKLPLRILTIVLILFHLPRLAMIPKPSSISSPFFRANVPTKTRRAGGRRNSTHTPIWHTLDPRPSRAGVWIKNGRGSTLIFLSMLVCGCFSSRRHGNARGGGREEGHGHPAHRRCGAPVNKISRRLCRHGHSQEREPSDSPRGPQEAPERDPRGPHEAQQCCTFVHIHCATLGGPLGTLLNPSWGPLVALWGSSWDCPEAPPKSRTCPRSAYEGPRGP